MNFDGLTMKLLTKELKNKCEFSQIQKILQIDKTTLLLRLNGQDGTTDLIITMGNKPSCYVSSPLAELPKEPSSLCMFLRKHYEGARITSIEQIHDDRLLHFTIDKLTLGGDIETKHIYIELMGKCSNCIFVENGIILESLIHVTPFMSQERQVLPKLPYHLPPNAERMCIGDFDVKTLKEMFLMRSSDSIVSAIRNLFNGFGTPIIRELEHRTNLSFKTLISDLNNNELNLVADTLIKVYQDIAASETLYYYELKTGKKIYSPIPLESVDVSPKTFSNISPLLENETKNFGSINTTKHQLETVLKAAIEKEKKRLGKIIKEFEETKRMDLYKKHADLLMIYAYMPHQFESSIDVIDCLSEEQNTITIPLKPELTLSQNGQAYYKRYNRLKSRLKHSQEQMQQSKAKISYLETVLFSLNNISSKQELLEIKTECQDYGIIKQPPRHMRQKPKAPKPLIIPIPDGRIVIGKNNRQNEEVTHKIGKPFDLWFHTKDVQGSHVILQTNVEPSEDLIIKAASYAAYYSKGRESDYVLVDYTFIKNVKKVAGAALGFVTYKDQKTINVKPVDPNANANKDQE